MKGEDTAILATFRQAELQRRQLRRERLLQQLNNEVELLNGELTSESDKEAHRIAVESFRRGAADFERLTRRGYWQRLWRALLNQSY